MTTYGDWEQGPDYSHPGQGQAVWGLTYCQRNYVWSGDPYGDKNDPMNAALDTTPGPDTPSSMVAMASLSVQAVSLDSGYYSGTPGGTWLTERDVGGEEWDAVKVMSDLYYYYKHVLAPSQPADATGLEFETQTATPVSALLHAPIDSWNHDESAPSGAVVTAPLQAHLYGGTRWASATNLLAEWEIDPSLSPVLDLDLTAYMGASGELGVSLMVTKSGTWQYFDPYQGGPISAGTMFSGTETSLVYTLRPPRHRWVYDTAPAAAYSPPEVVYPREDGRATGSAEQVYPPPRSVQSMGEVYGGYR